MAKKNFDVELKKKVVRQYLEGNRTVRSLSAEYGAAPCNIYDWIKKYKGEFTSGKTTIDYRQQVNELKRELAMAREENEFLRTVTKYCLKTSSMNLLPEVN